MWKIGFLALATRNSPLSMMKNRTQYIYDYIMYSSPFLRVTNWVLLYHKDKGKPQTTRTKLMTGSYRLEKAAHDRKKLSITLRRKSSVKNYYWKVIAIFRRGSTLVSTVLRKTPDFGKIIKYLKNHFITDSFWLACPVCCWSCFDVVTQFCCQTSKENRKAYSA